MKPYRFHRDADAEFADAALYYADKNAELGQRFYHHIQNLLEEICSGPTRYRAFMPPARRHFRLTFPYAVVYIDRPDYVWIIAISPFKREPGYWLNRLEK